MNTALDVQIRGLADRLGVALGSPDIAAEIRRRMDEPLRVAIAGRVKAGKSTLLNALVGERLAATDAGECTKVVTWYRHGLEYAVLATLDDGATCPVPFRRQRDRLLLDLSELDVEGVARLDVRWPSALLRRYTLVDTPGLEAHDRASASRTRHLLGLESGGQSEVDAVVYLMQHAHRLDVEFLEAFTDHSMAHPSPVNAVAVLSRADEIGAGRPDALESASIIAARCAADPRIRSLCATVLPVAGLIAETGRTLQESEGGTLRAIADLPVDETRAMSLSVDRFVDPDRSPIDPNVRRQLLLRLGMFGVRHGVAQLASSTATTSDLARSLVEASGVERLAALLDEHFGRRAELLKVRSAIARLKALATHVQPGPERAALVADIERIEGSAAELGELRLLHLVISGAAGFDPDEVAEVSEVVSDETAAVRLGLPDDASADDMTALIVRRLDGWRRRAAHPLSGTDRREACELMAATYERLYASVAAEGTVR